MQNLVNEHIQIHGIEVYYLPRKIFKTDNIIKEIQSSKFDDSFLIEAYLNNVDGYAPEPPPPEIVMVGATVYPAPAFVISSLKIEVTLAL